MSARLKLKVGRDLDVRTASVYVLSFFILFILFILEILRSLELAFISASYSSSHYYYYYKKKEKKLLLSVPLITSFAPETNHGQTGSFFLINQYLLNNTTYFFLFSIFLLLLVAVSQPNTSYLFSEIFICSF